VNVLIVDDHPIVVSGFKALLEADGGITVASASCVADAEHVLAQHPCDVAVVDINLPGLSGFELARRLLSRDADARILMFSMNDDPVFVAQAIGIGAQGFISKNDNPVAMLRAVRAVAEGGSFWPAGSDGTGARSIDQGSARAPTALSARDGEILRQLAKGRSLSEIADLVGVSYKTVAQACANLRTRLNARTQAELVAIAVDQKLV
jgi:two-component system, NarL family, invasion response regulator UvrY